MSTPAATTALDLAFAQARTVNTFTAQAVSDDTLRQLYDLAKWGPTSMNAQPGRFIFVRSPAAKARLAPALAAGNLDKSMAAPVTVIVAQDTQFYEHLKAMQPCRKPPRPATARCKART
jgi:3-hydroxypropanoate dehydrogenase